MFRRVEKSLPPDASYPADLKQLGYFINEAGQIRLLEYPDKGFKYYISNIERHNEVHKEAMQGCQREEVLDRLSALGIEKLYLPNLSNSKPDNEPHISILAPPADVLKTRKRVIVLINDSLHDLGILAYRELQREPGLNGGSVINFAKEILSRSTEAKAGFDIFKDGAVIEDKKDTPGLIVMNCGQLLYSHKTNETLSLQSWAAKPRDSICHDMVQIHETENRNEGHRTEEEHIKSVFDKVLHNPEFVAADAEIYVIAIQGGAENFLNILGGDLDKYGSRITAIAAIDSGVDAIRVRNPTLKIYLHQRTRQWIVSDRTDPRTCIEVPTSYAAQTEDLTKGRVESHSTPNWLETVSPTSGPASTFASLYQHLKMVVTSNQSALEPELTKFPYDYDPICLGFGGGGSSFGECVFTAPAVQHAILDFFEEVAQNPSEYRNPAFDIDIDIDVDVPEPTPGNPLTLTTPDPEDSEYATFQAMLPSEMSPEQQEVDDHKEKLASMKASLEATPKDSPELCRGRLGLEKRIVKAESELVELQKKALASGGLKAGEAEEIREKWEPQIKGPKIPFAGTMVDSELVKGAGLFQTAEEALEELDSGHGD